MFEKIENSWKLAKGCWRVLMLDKEMLAFPFMAFISSVLVLGTLAYPFWASQFTGVSGTVPSVAPEVLPLAIDGSSMMLGWLLLTIVPTYICYFIMVFFNAGLTTCAFIRLCDGDPVLKDGFAMAWERLPKLFAYSVMAATIGLLLRMVKGRNNLLRSLLGATLDLGWRVASFFTVPTIIAEDKGAIDALKRSGQLVKRNWGEALTLEIGFSVLAYPAMVPFFVLVGFSYSIGQSLPIISAVLVTIAFVYMFIISLVFSTLDAIAKAALYMYAKGEETPEGFEPTLLDSIFKQTNDGKPSLA